MAALDDCSFKTDRLSVGDWTRQSACHEWLDNRGVILSGLLTPGVTRWLPSGWQGQYDPTRAEEWLLDREAEGPVLFVVETATVVVGVMMLFESPQTDVRLGYLLAEQAWGRGLASELVGGFVCWYEANPAIRHLVAGVDQDNVASVRVLEKNGFVPSVRSDESGTELTFVLERSLG